MPKDLQLFHQFLSKMASYPKFSLIILGALGTFGFAPFYLFPLTILSFTLFLLLLERSPFQERPFWAGFLFSFGHFLGGTYWLANCFKVVGLWYVMPVVWSALPGFLALAHAFGVWGSVRLTTIPIARVFLFSAFWSMLNYVTGTWILGGFPWVLPGYIWGISVLQVTSIIGIYGLSFLTLILMTCLVSRSPLFIFMNAVSFLGLYMGGQVVLKNNPTTFTDVNIRLIQGSIPQDHKWLTEYFYENFNHHMVLSTLEAEKPLTVTIWSEASIPAYVEEYPSIQQALAQAVPANGYLFVGGPRRNLHNPEEIYTSFFALNPQGQILETYDKVHLVPFGEYVPYKKFLPLPKVTAGMLDYSPGAEMKVISLPGIPPFTPLICFEAIFPGQVTPGGNSQRPEWLLNQTNDAWYGESSGPYQHLQIVRTRAIEERLPIVRSANNGISAVIDSYGRILSKLDLNDIGFIDEKLPTSPFKLPSFYAKHKENSYLFILLLSLLYSFVRITVKGKLKKIFRIK